MRKQLVNPQTWDWRKEPGEKHRHLNTASRSVSRTSQIRICSAHACPELRVVVIRCASGFQVLTRTSISYPEERKNDEHT